MSFWQIVHDHYIVVGSIAGYIALTFANHMPDDRPKNLDDIYNYVHDVVKSLAASPVAARFEQKYNLQPVENHVPIITNQPK
jgi:hypothetical protein